MEFWNNILVLALGKKILFTKEKITVIKYVDPVGILG